MIQTGNGTPRRQCRRSNFRPGSIAGVRDHNTDKRSTVVGDYRKKTYGGGTRRAVRGQYTHVTTAHPSVSVIRLEENERIPLPVWA